MTLDEVIDRAWAESTWTTKAQLQQMARLQAGAPRGDVAEFGVAKGASALVLAWGMRAEDRLFLVDTFQGDGEPRLEDVEYSGPGIGDIEGKCKGEVESVRALLKGCNPAIELLVGDVEDSFENLPDRLVFVNLDVDLYRPTKAVLEGVQGRMVKGGVIHVNGFWGGVRKAVQEHAEGHGLMVESNLRRMWLRC